MHDTRDFQPTQRAFVKYFTVSIYILLFSMSSNVSANDESCPLDLWIICIDGLKLRTGVTQHYIKVNFEGEELGIAKKLAILERSLG